MVFTGLILTNGHRSVGIIAVAVETHAVPASAIAGDRIARDRGQINIG